MKSVTATKAMALTLLSLLLLVSVAGACTKPTPAPSPAPTPAPAPKTAPVPAPAPTPKPAPKPAAGLPAEIDIATYPIGTNAYVVATGWAAILGKNTPMKVVAKPLTGPSVYMARVNAGEFAIGVDASASANRAFIGDGEFEGKRMPNLRALWHSYDTSTSVPLMVRKDSKYFRVEDLKGARVTSDYGGNHNILRYITAALAGAGMTWDDVIKVPVASMTGGWDALRDGRAVAAYGGSVTAPAAVELHAAIGIRFIGYSRNPTEIPEFKKLLPGNGGHLVKPEPGLIIDREIWGEIVPFWYVASTAMSDEAAYQIVKTVWERDTEIQPILHIVKDWSRQKILADLTVPVHPGAIRFYKEKGVWTPKLEQQQADLLKR